MILRCTFEELSALSSGAERVLADAGSQASVAAPPEALADVEALYPRLQGDISIPTLSQQRRVESALEFLLEELRGRMEQTVLDRYVGSDDAVNAYFDFANVLTVHDRVRGMGREMTALIELMTGDAPTPQTARSITFPDD